MSDEKTQCAGQVVRKGADVWRTKYEQCGKRGAHEHEGKFYCKTHHPPTVATKREKTAQKWRAGWDAKAQTAARFNAALDACRQIAAGHNDPRALAAAVVAMPPKENGE
jgi:hypothetical protein